MPEPEQQDMQRRPERRASANDEARHAPQQQRSRHSSQQKMMRDAHRKERRRQGAERRYEEEAQHAHRGPEGRRDVAAQAKKSDQSEREQEPGIAIPAREPVARQRRRAAKIGRAHAELQSLMRISYAVFC